MHIDACNDEDLRRSASIQSGNPLRYDSSGIDETYYSVVISFKKNKKKTKNRGVQRALRKK